MWRVFRNFCGRFSILGSSRTSGKRGNSAIRTNSASSFRAPAAFAAGRIAAPRPRGRPEGSGEGLAGAARPPRQSGPSVWPARGHRGAAVAGLLSRGSKAALSHEPEFVRTKKWPRLPEVLRVRSENLFEKRKKQPESDAYRPIHGHGNNCTRQRTGVLLYSVADRVNSEILKIVKIHQIHTAMN